MVNSLTFNFLKTKSFYTLFIHINKHINKHPKTKTKSEKIKIDSEVERCALKVAQPANSLSVLEERIKSYDKM